MSKKLIHDALQLAAIKVSQEYGIEVNVISELFATIPAELYCHCCVNTNIECPTDAFELTESIMVKNVNITRSELGLKPIGDVQ